MIGNDFLFFISLYCPQLFSALPTLRRSWMEPKPDDTKCGFRHGRRSTEYISTLQQIFQESWEHAKDAYTCFVDLGKVCDRVPREKLWRCCGSAVLTCVSCWPSSNCFPAQKIVTMSTELSQNRSTLVFCLRQGCVLSPLLFIVYIRVLQTTTCGPNLKIV